MSNNILKFPGTGVITVDEMMADLNASHAKGEIKHLLVVTMEEDTSTTTAFTSSPAHCMVYMCQHARMKIERIMEAKGMVP